MIMMNLLMTVMIVMTCYRSATVPTPEIQYKQTKRISTYVVIRLV